MFDWNDQDQVGDTIWDELSEAEDHIVPFPNGAEENLLNFGDFGRKQKEEAGSIFRSLEHTSGDKNDYSGTTTQGNSSTYATNPISGSRLDMGSWSDLPSLNAALGKAYDDADDQDSLATELINDFSEPPNLTEMKVGLDAEPEIFSNDQGDRETENYLDCGWENLGDFDDIDRMFSNSDSIFGREMVDNAEFLSTSSDVISNTAQSIPMPDMPSNKDQHSEPGSSPFQFDELFSGNTHLEEQIANKTAISGEQTDCKSHVTRGYHDIQHQFCEKSNLQADNLKRELKTLDKSEEGSKNNASKNFDGTWPHNVNEIQQLPSQPLHAFNKSSFKTHHSSAVCQQNQLRAHRDVGQPGSSNQYLLPGYNYSPYPFTIPVFQNIHVESNEPASVGYKVIPDPSKHSNSLDKKPNIPSRPIMTPQEKIDKLRRRQQMQAMLAIQQQQQQFGHQVTPSDIVVPQASPRKQTQNCVTNDAIEEGENKQFSSELNVKATQDEPQTLSSIGDDYSLAETMYYQLQDALGKLDIKIRLCIRDSLFRLAQSAMQRQSAKDRSSTNISNTDEDEPPVYETKMSIRVTKTQDEETGTNPIDRTVAHLLFHRPSESVAKAVKEEIQSPKMLNHASNPPSLNSHPTAKEENQNIGDVEAQPSEPK